MKHILWQYRIHSRLSSFNCLFLERKRPWKTWRRGAEIYSKKFGEFVPWAELCDYYARWEKVSINTYFTDDYGLGFTKDEASSLYDEFLK